MSKLFKNQYLIFLGYLIVSVLLLWPILKQSGVPFKYDWSWPFFSMSDFWHLIVTSNPADLLPVFSKNGMILMSFFGLFKVSPSPAIKIFLVLIHTFAGYGFYRFIRTRVKSNFVALIAGLAYAFTPYIFIRTVIGFIWSLVAYAVLPYFLGVYFKKEKSWGHYLLAGFLLTLIFSQIQAGLLTLLVLVISFLLSIIRSFLSVIPAKAGIQRSEIKKSGSRIPTTPRLRGASKSGMTNRVSGISHEGLKTTQKRFKSEIVSFSATMGFFFLSNLPWFIIYLTSEKDTSVLSGTNTTTLEHIAALPHSFLNLITLSDHHITNNFFYFLNRDKIFLLGYAIVIFVILIGIVRGVIDENYKTSHSSFRTEKELTDSKNKYLVWTLLISSIAILPFLKGPTGIFAGTYTYVYNHFPQITVFRETYHFQFLLAFALITLFGLGLDSIYSLLQNSKLSIKKGSKSVRKPKNHNSKTKILRSEIFILHLQRVIQRSRLLKITIITLATGSVMFVIAPYLTFNYAEYFKLQPLPSEYQELKNYLVENENQCENIYYPPGLGFVYFKNDKSSAASNSDLLAVSLGRDFLDSGTSVLDRPNDERYFRNELVSQFYEQNDKGEFSALMSEGNIDCLILRLDTESKYSEVSNLSREKDLGVLKKWNNTDLLSLTESKVGLSKIKTIGNNIHIFGLNPNNTILSSKQYHNNKLNIIGCNSNPPAGEGSESWCLPPDPNIISLGETDPRLNITDWASEFSWYKDGWSRGRYDFWRKHLFTFLRQDFIYTNKQDMSIKGKIDLRGKYELWARHLTGGTEGEIELRIQNTEYGLKKEPGDERFVWKDLGEVDIQDGEITITNISGENAIADIVLVPKN